MSRDTRWAARYQFLEECWRGQDRILLDAGLERLLLDGGLDVASLGHDPVAQLLDLLLPSRPADGQAWMVLSHGRRAAELSRIRPETRFVSVSDAISVAAEDPWRLAMVDLEGYLNEADVGDDPDIGARLDPQMLALIETLGERAGSTGPSRMVAVSMPVSAPPAGVGRGPEADAQLADHVDGQVEAFAALVAELLPGARLFGIAWPQVASIYGLGSGDDEDASREATDALEAYDAELDAAEADWNEEAKTQIYETAGEELPIDYDNTRADAVPRFRSLLAVLGPDVVVDGLGEGVTLLELPAGGGEAASPFADEAGTGRELSELRTQLAQARRQAQMLSVEKQRLLEELDQTRERLDAAREGETSGPAVPSERLDLALAQHQQLRWELDRARDRIGELEGRPVTELEAEIASLRARNTDLHERVVRDGAASEGADDPKARDDGPKGGAREHAPTAANAGATGRASARRAESDRPRRAGTRLRDVVAGQLDRLLRRVERGGISTLELHRTLRALKEALPRL